MKDLVIFIVVLFGIGFGVGLLISNIPGFEYNPCHVNFKVIHNHL